MARWSAQHRKKAIFGWLGLVVALFAINMTSPMKTIVRETSGPGESGRADTILYEDFKQPAGEEVLIQSDSLTTDDPAFRAAVQAVIAGVSKLDAVGEVKSPFDAENSGFISADKHSALVPMEIRGPSEDAADKVDPIVARVAEVQKANPDLYVGSFGESTNKALQASFKDDLKRAGHVLDPADADHPPRRIRRARSGRHPAPAGTHVRPRHARRGRTHQPGVADVRLGLGDHPPDRARRRGRLHDVLLEARA